MVLFDVPNRREIRNLTYGFTHDYEYLIAQNITVGRKLGRDLAFSPDGDTIAVFAKRESGRSLVLIDVIEGGHRRVIDLTEEFGVEQELSPAFSPDGTKVAFSAWKDGDFDIYSYDLESGELTNLTDDDLFDGSPAYSPDGRWLAFTSVVDGYQKLFRIDLQDRSHREQLTHGKSNERDAVYSADGERIYFTSDQTDAENIYSADLETGDVVQHTNAVTGCVMPAVFEDREGHERMAYTGFWRLTPALYLADPEEATLAVGAEEAAEAEAAAEAGIEEPERPLRAPSLMEFGIEPAVPEELPRFEPDIQVAVDEANEEDYHGFHLGLDNAQTVVAIDSDSTVLGQAILSWSDLIGDRRLITTLTSVDRFSDFDVVYYNTARRLNWALHLYDNRDYFFTLNQDGEFNRHSLYEETGLVASVWYPFNFYNRIELGAGAIYRNIEQPAYIRNRRTRRAVPGLRAAVGRLSGGPGGAGLRHHGVRELGAGGRPPDPARRGLCAGSERRRHAERRLQPGRAPVRPADPAQQPRLPGLRRGQQRQLPAAVLDRRSRHPAGLPVPVRGRRPGVFRQLRVPVPADRHPRPALDADRPASAAGSSSTSAAPGSAGSRTSTSRTTTRTGSRTGCRPTGSACPPSCSACRSTGSSPSAGTSRTPKEGSGPASGSGIASEGRPRRGRIGGSRRGSLALMSDRR